MIGTRVAAAPASVWLTLARPRQWMKNLLVLAAFLFTAGDAWQPGDAASWLPLLARAAAAFALFCVLSAGGYYLNDARDAEADRAHPRKQDRPIARGIVGQDAARQAGRLLLAAGVVLSFGLGPWFAAAAGAYAAGTVAYSAGLKDRAMVDVSVVAALFALRAVAGAAAIDVAPSPWLAVCTFSGALFVSAVKRGQEQALLGSDAGLHRATLGVAHGARRVGMLARGAGLATASLYTAYAATASNLPSDHSMLVTAPIVWAGLARYWWTARARPDRDADEVVLRDPVLVVIVGTFVLLSLALLTRG